MWHGAIAKIGRGVGFRYTQGVVVTLLKHAAMGKELRCDATYGCNDMGNGYKDSQFPRHGWDSKVETKKRA